MEQINGGLSVASTEKPKGEVLGTKKRKLNSQTSIDPAE